jgi:hypothetical protein
MERLSAYRAVNILQLDYTEASSLMLYKAKVAVCPEIHTQQMQCEQNLEFWNFKPGGK